MNRKDDLPIREQVGHGKEEQYYFAENSHSFYVLLSSWAESTLGWGRCGAVCSAVAFAKRGAVLYGQVAIKYPHGVDTDGWLLLNERNVFVRLQNGDIDKGKGHPNIVRAMGWIPKVLVDGDVERSAIVLEFVDGWTLQDVCSRWHRSLWILMDVLMIRWLVQLGKALQYMHRHRIVHNDLKLHNVMIKKEGMVLKIIDFGMSRVTPIDDPCDWQADMRSVGRMVAQLIAHRSPQALQAYNGNPTEQGCEHILRTFGRSFLGVQPELERLMQGKMDALEFTTVMEQCKERILYKQTQTRNKMQLEGVDYSRDLRTHLAQASTSQLKSQTRGFAKL